MFTAERKNLPLAQPLRPAGVLSGIGSVKLKGVQRRLPRPPHRCAGARPRFRARRMLPAALPLLAALALAPAASAAPAIAWAPEAPMAGAGAATAVSCPGEGTCEAVDAAGDALATLAPASPSPSWQASVIDAVGAPLTGVSCAPPSGPCVAVDAHGAAFSLAVAGSSGWSGSIPTGAADATAVSCPSAGLCVAAGAAGEILANTPAGSGHWTAAGIASGRRLTAVSCSSAAACVAVDSGGHAYASTDPAGGAPAWHAAQIDFAGLSALACYPGGCVAGDSAGNVLASPDPLSAAPTWSLTPVDGEALTSLACSEAGLCVAGDARGEALSSDAPLAAVPSWSASGVASVALAGISCTSGGLCVAVDGHGRSHAGRPPAPATATLPPATVTTEAATLSGSVDPLGAALTECVFEYGTSSAYGAAVPCASLPAPAGGPQFLSAAVAGLRPNTTYHYRLLARSASGAGVGADVAFTTPASSQIALVSPHPSLTGTPAPGQRLYCHANLAAGESATLTYGWLRDGIPIAGQSGSSYGVLGQDGGHHLQCQVTATDGGGSATARSGFANVPQAGAPAAAGETTVGTARYSRSAVAVPVRCSREAEGGCWITLRLSVVETLRGGRVVAAAARRGPPGHGASFRRVVIASARVRLATGAGRTVTLPLGRLGGRLLSTLKHFTAALEVSGTVIGLIEARLALQSVAVGAAARHASRR